MTREWSERVWAVFDRVAELPAGERAAFLDGACAGDAGLRAEVESLLAHDVAPTGKGTEADFLKSPLVRPPRAPATDVTPRRPSPALLPRVGRYRILRILGEGGMGTVYEAEQDNPRRPVALKVIRPGLVSPGLLKRFHQEAQLLGRLHHPGIAQIYEAGVAEDGQPFFAMEFIHGVPLDEYARRQSLTVPQRLELMARVCDAVQHAHDQGIIHRDLKPGNILVNGTRQPKVLDFGVARATDADLQTTTGRTETGQPVGTLGYMSPEQVVADPAALEARSDVYTLGVILYELLAGRPPYRLEGLPLPELARVIREEEPSRLGLINSVFRGDVETIVAKALEKDRTRRYARAGELAADIRRYLSHQPILARPVSRLYQLRKFVRRHKALVGGASAVFAALLVGTIVSILFALRAEHNAQVAREKERVATYEAYRARLAAAVAALSNHDVADAARQLQEAPQELRGWEWHHLQSRLDDSSVEFPASAGESLFLLHGPEGLRMGGHTPTGLRLASLDGRELVRRSFPRAGKLYHSPLWTQHGFRLVQMNGDRVRLLDRKGYVRTSLKAPPNTTPAHLTISPDGSLLGAAWEGSPDWTITVYEAASGKQRAICTEPKGYIWALAFSPGGRQIASAGEDGVARLWDVATGALTAECGGHKRKVLSVAFRPDGKRLVTTSADGSVRQWNPETGDEVEPPYTQHSGEVATAAYSPDGQWIASGGTDRTVRLWHAKGREDAAVLHGHTGSVIEVAFTPNGRQLASVSQHRPGYDGDDTVRVWEADVQAGLPVLRGHSSYVYPVAYSPDGRWIASGSWDGTVRLWDARTGEPCADLRVGKRNRQVPVRTLAFIPHSTWLAVGSDESGQLQIWDVPTARIRKVIQTPGTYLRFLAVSPDGTKIVASVYSDATPRMVMTVTEVATGKTVFSDRAGAIAFSPDGRWLAGRGDDPSIVVLWDTRTYRRSKELPGHRQLIHTIAFSQDGRRLASAGSDRSVRVWDVATGECLDVLTGHTEEVFGVAFHPDGSRLATAGRDRAIWLWDLATGQEMARLQGHSDYIWSLAFSPGGKTLVSGSGDGTVRLWDTEPLAKRYQVRRDARALRPRAERLVQRLFRAKKDTAAVVAVLQADGSLSERLREAALHAVLRRTLRPQHVPENNRRSH
jgi:WD40 repeat protein/serine/threonine protein kinase